MPRYRVTPEDLLKRKPGRRSMALELLIAKNLSPKELAGLWDVHPTTTYRLFERLRKAGYAKREEGMSGIGATYSIVEKGRHKLGYLQGLGSKDEEPEKTSEELYPELGRSAALIEGPVALMRVAEVDYEKFEEEGIDALPSKVELAEDDVACERKFDGWLSQSAGGTLYSRRGKLLSGKLPPIDRELSNFEGEHIIGELVYWDHQTRKMNESNVTRVAGTDNPMEAARKMMELEQHGFFQIVVFDLIAHEGEDISKLPFAKRRSALENLIGTTNDRKERLTLSPVYDFGNWRKVFQAALVEGGEGVVLKNTNAPYLWRSLGEREATPSGTMWKVKAVRSDDFIVFDSFRSEKDKLIVKFGQLWKGELVEVGDMDNFSAENEKEIQKRLKKGPFVMEIAFQERFGKPPCRLRNPRMLRFRSDKPIESVTLPTECIPD